MTPPVSNTTYSSSAMSRTERDRMGLSTLVTPSQDVAQGAHVTESASCAQGSSSDMDTRLAAHVSVSISVCLVAFTDIAASP